MLMLGDQSSGISFAAARIRSICSGSKPVVARTSGSLFCRQVSRIALGRLGDREIDDHVDRHEQFGRQRHAQGPGAGDDAGVVAQERVARRFQGRGHRQLRIGRAQGDQAAAHAAGRAVNGYANCGHRCSLIPFGSRLPPSIPSP